MKVEQAGAVTYRITGDVIEYLIVKSKKNPQKWIFPKGHIEPGETKAKTATRELAEESGVKGECIGAIGVISFDYNGDQYEVEYYLHKFTEVVGAGEKGRTPTWVDYKKVCELVSYKETLDLLTKAQEIIKGSDTKTFL